MASRALSHYRAAPSKQQLHHNNNVGTARRRCSQLSGTRRSAAGCGLLVLANKASTRTTRIVLRQPVRGLGVPGDLCDVKPGYFRNYLGPFGFAKLATPDVLAEVQAKIDAEAKAKEEVKQQAEQVRRPPPPPTPPDERLQYNNNINSLTFLDAIHAKCADVDAY